MNKISIRTIQKLTGIHWETIRNIHVELMERTLKEHTEKVKEAGYHPKYPAVDEFVIRKGYTYTTCVMDLEIAEVFWVGNGRSQEEFQRFFWEV